MRKSCIKIGARVTFVPSHRLSDKIVHPDLSKHPTEQGVITYVNHNHRFFRVEYAAGRGGDVTLSECFKF